MGGEKYSKNSDKDDGNMSLTHDLIFFLNHANLFLYVELDAPKIGFSLALAMEKKRARVVEQGQV